MIPKIWQSYILNKSIKRILEHVYISKYCLYIQKLNLCELKGMKRVQSLEFYPEYQNINNTMCLFKADCALFFNLLLQKQYWKNNIQNPYLLKCVQFYFQFLQNIRCIQKNTHKRNLKYINYWHLLILFLKDLYSF